MPPPLCGHPPGPGCPLHCSQALPSGPFAKRPRKRLQTGSVARKRQQTTRKSAQTGANTCTRVLRTRPRSFPPPLQRQGTVKVQEASENTALRAQQTPQTAQTARKRPQTAANGSKRLQTAPNGSKQLQATANGTEKCKDGRKRLHKNALDTAKVVSAAAAAPGAGECAKSKRNAGFLHHPLACAGS